jgi:hypothetical protein
MDAAAPQPRSRRPDLASIQEARQPFFCGCGRAAARVRRVQLDVLDGLVIPSRGGQAASFASPPIGHVVRTAGGVIDWRGARALSMCAPAVGSDERSEAAVAMCRSVQYP